jgi:class 3 adenylate cyclase
MERRLAAILIAMSSPMCLSQADEEERAPASRPISRSFRPAIAVHHGCLVKTMGDALLVEFHSVVDAERCAVEVSAARPSAT